METPRDKILEMLHQQGKSDQVDQAKQEQRDKVGPERDSGLLEKFGLKPRTCCQSSAAVSRGAGELLVDLVDG